MGSTTSISFRKRNEADEIFVFPVQINPTTFQRRNSVLMVEYQGDGTVLIIAGKIPGMSGYYKNYPDVVDRDEEALKEYNLSRKLLEKAIDCLEEYDPQTSSSESNSGNRSMNDIYVEVDEEKKDEVILKMWKLLNHLRDEYVTFLQEHRPEDFTDYPQLQDEVVQITKQCDDDKGYDSGSK